MELAPSLRLVPAVLVLILTACTGKGGGPTVVVYTSVDQTYAERVLRAYEAASGVRVRAVFDVEAAKTTGLVNRLLAEKDRPQADVWWSGEFAQTVELANKGVLESYASPAAAGIPAAYRDSENRWVGFGGRARVLLVNTERVRPGEEPKSIFDLTAEEAAAEMVGMAYPMFGTAATHAAALYAALGAERARTYYRALRDRGITLLDGNSVVRDQVADGRLAWGITDTDDACGAVERGAPVRLVFPDQGPEDLGTLVIPNTVALVAGGPHPEEGRRFMDYLLQPEREAELMQAGWLQLALRPTDVRLSCPETTNVKGMAVSLAEVAAHIEEAKSDMAAIFVR